MCNTQSSSVRGHVKRGQGTENDAPKFDIQPGSCNRAAFVVGSRLNT